MLKIIKYRSGYALKLTDNLGRVRILVRPDGEPADSLEEAKILLRRVIQDGPPPTKH